MLVGKAPTVVFSLRCRRVTRLHPSPTGAIHFRALNCPPAPSRRPDLCGYLTGANVRSCTVVTDATIRREPCVPASSQRDQCATPNHTISVLTGPIRGNALSWFSESAAAARIAQRNPILDEGVRRRHMVPLGHSTPHRPACAPVPCSSATACAAARSGHHVMIATPRSRMHRPTRRSGARYRPCPRAPRLMPRVGRRTRRLASRAADQHPHAAPS